MLSKFIAISMLSCSIAGATDFPYADNCVDSRVDQYLSKSGKGGPAIAWQCNKCGYYNNAIYRYCQKCGAKYK